MIRLLLSAIFMFFLPGYTLINAVYPGSGELNKELDILYRIVYSIGISVAIVIITGFLLGHLPGNGFVSINIWVSLVSFSLIFFFIGWYRGAYQRLDIISPRLTRSKPKVLEQDDEDANKVKKLQELVRKRASLKEDIKYSKSKEDEKKAKKQLEKVEKRLKELEKDREKDF